MQLAAYPLSFSLETSSDTVPALWPIPSRLESPGVKAAPISPMLIFPALQTGWFSRVLGFFVFKNCICMNIYFLSSHVDTSYTAPVSKIINMMSIGRYIYLFVAYLSRHKFLSQVATIVGTRSFVFVVTGCHGCTLQVKWPIIVSCPGKRATCHMKTA